MCKPTERILIVIIQPQCIKRDLSYVSCIPSKPYPVSTPQSIMNLRSYSFHPPYSHYAKNEASASDRMVSSAAG